jgi:hypothetical protein
MDLAKVINDLMEAQTYVGLQKHYLILWFYMFVIFITSTVGHVMDKQNGFTNGMIFGFILSMILWFQYGRTMVY